MARGDDAAADAFEAPATSRIRPGGGTGRGLRAVGALVAAGLVLAVLKPWDWSPPPTAPGRDRAAIPGASPAESSTPASAAPEPESWTDLADRVACLSGRLWMAVVDKVDGPTVARTWTRLDVVPTADPAGGVIASVHAYAEAVPRLGFCAPTGADVAGGAAATPYRVQAWRLDPAVPEVRASTLAAIDLRIVAGGTRADHGVLYGPPPETATGAAAASTPDPEGAWSRGVGLVPRAAGWSPEADPSAAPGSWPSGTYVFRVDLADAGAGDAEAAWFAIELRGPWTGPREADAPASSDGPAEDGPTPAP
ncbi:MAG: hypothetical protein MUE92_04200 [Chloroflexi bacterium]|nr:hypothetical protein [Chloroflexota bacterium]